MGIDALYVGLGNQNTSGANTVTSAGTTSVSGSTFVALFSWGGGGTASVTDSKGNTYTMRGPMMDAYGGGMRSAVFVCENGTGGSSHTATASVSSGSTDSALHLIEIVGADAASLDLYPDAAHDTSSPFTDSTGTLSQADELILSFCASDSGSNPTTYACTDFTKISSEMNGGLYWTSAVAKKIVSATDSVTASWTSTGATAAYVHVLSFKAASVIGIFVQEGFRWFGDGTESGSSSIAAQDANVTRPLGANITLRVLIDRVTS